ncbi:DUF6817 domain-containing protein [Comamonas sp.]|uniref:DUF6817 domain-containing protein n=1 Tax=Comamonas sp. TaxID=34028 RepID=UPI002898DAAE|nr:tetratricopeptide repeat protein [Comamonas sp.]
MNAALPTATAHALPLQALDPAQWLRAKPLLDENWIHAHPALARALPVVLARDVGQDWHKAGTFRHHLLGVTRTLQLWQQPEDVKLLGLLHSVYGNAFVDLVKFDASSERSQLAALVGEPAEQLVYAFCVLSRAQFVQKVLAGAIEPDGAVLLDHQGAPRRVEPYTVAAFIIVSMADTIEQWFSWQDDIFSSFPQVPQRPQKAHWMASLWPGPMRPSGRMLSQIASLGLALQHPGLQGLLPMPPVFANCTQGLSAAADAAAASLYWSVIQQDQPLTDLDVATGVLEQAVQLNPWVGEPQMVLAQLYLSAGRDADALAAADSALQCFSQWGNAWDKRVQWDAWVAWTRILQQHARNGNWPERLDKLNNVALRPE